MPSARLAVLAALAAAVSGLTTTAQAAPAPTFCKLVVDDPKDTRVMGQVAQQDDSMDILSGDVASNGTQVTGVIRVQKWADADHFAPLGRVFYVQWVAKGAPGPVFLSAGKYPNVEEFSFGFLDESQTPARFTSLGAATGKFDAAKNEIRVTANLKDLVANKLGAYKRGETLGSLLLEARVFTGQNVVSRPSALPSTVPFIRGLVSTVDDATSGKKYPLGARSCVAVGK